MDFTQNSGEVVKVLVKTTKRFWLLIKDNKICSGGLEFEPRVLIVCSCGEIEDLKESPGACRATHRAHEAHSTQQGLGSSLDPVFPRTVFMAR